MTPTTIKAGQSARLKERGTRQRAFQRARRTSATLRIRPISLLQPSTNCARSCFSEVLR